MSGVVGRDILVKKGVSGTVVAAGRTKTFNMAAEPIDITSDDDSGFRTFLEGVAAQKSLDMSFEGITKSADFISALTNGDLVDAYEIEIPGIGTIAGTFQITSASISGAYNEASTFTVEFQSSGQWTFTPAA